MCIKLSDFIEWIDNKLFYWINEFNSKELETVSFYLIIMRNYKRWLENKEIIFKQGILEILEKMDLLKKKTDY